MNFLVKAFNLIISTIGFIKLSFKKDNEVQSEGVSIIIFSYDRPFQLNSLLRSLFENFPKNKINNLSIVYKFSDKFDKSYDELKMAYKEKANINWYSEGEYQSFKDALISAIKNITDPQVMFMVDDQLFYRKLSASFLQEVSFYKDAIFTFRFSKKTKYSYTLNKDVCLPELSFPSKRIMSWQLNGKQFEFNYVFSVDATIFPYWLANLFINKLIYNGPNYFESSMNYSSWLYKRFNYIAYSSVDQYAVNIVLGKVQSINDNKSLGIDKYTLLNYFHSKKILEINKKNEIFSPHIDSNYNIIYDIDKI